MLRRAASRDDIPTLHACCGASGRAGATVDVLQFAHAKRPVAHSAAGMIMLPAATFLMGIRS